MTLILGTTPEPLEVHVSKNGSFDCTLTSVDATGAAVNFPVGTLVYIVLNSGTWNATVSGNTAVFTRTVTQVNATITWGKKQTATLFYENGTDKIIWAKGSLVVNA